MYSKAMDENPMFPLVSNGSISGVKFGITTSEETIKYSISDCAISHHSQLSNPFLGLPLERGRCESCGTEEVGQCEGHFGFIRLPVPIYHPSHVGELKNILSLVCLKCLRMKRGKVKNNRGNEKVSSTSCSYCRDLPPMSINEIKKTDGAICLELKVSSRARLRDGFWNFLERFGFRYGDAFCRPLLPYEALNIINAIPEETKKKLAGKGYFPQEGFIMQQVPVPPNCLCVPKISDGKSIMFSDISNTLLKKILNKVELIKRSRSGSPNFESLQVESNDLQCAVAQYMLLRGTTESPHDITKRFASSKEANICSTSTKQWLEKIRTLFISKGSSFSSRSVITGDTYIEIDTIGLPSEVAERITFEERVTMHNMRKLQDIVDKRLCVTYKDGSSTFAIAVGSKGHTNLKIGQVINRRIMDGDMVFINRPPSTHKHSLQAFTVFVHNDHTIKINPLVCAPFGADFDGDCIHIFYPQSFAAKAEVCELFSVEKQLLSSHTGNLNLQLAHDALLSLKIIFNTGFVRRTAAHQLAMFVSPILPPPAIVKSRDSGPLWSIPQILQTVFPVSMDCHGENYSISGGEILDLSFNRDSVNSSFVDIVTSMYKLSGPREVIKFYNLIQPVLMEILSTDGFSISLKDFYVPKYTAKDIRWSVRDFSCILSQLRSGNNRHVEVQIESHLKSMKSPITKFILNRSAIGNLIDPKSESAIAKVVQQLGFLGLQLSDHGKYYSKGLVEDCFSNFVNKYSSDGADHPSEAYGLVMSSLFHGLNPYEELVHAISSREVMVRSSRGLTEPGTLFKSMMAILRDVIICYDGTVRNVCSGSIVQFESGKEDASNSLDTPPGEPVGALAATAIAHQAYKAVFDSSQSNNSSWELMKEILLCKVSYRNDICDRRVMLYLNDCCCGKIFCNEKAAFAVLNCLKKVILKDCANCSFIEYQKQRGPEATSGLVGHIHLDEMQLKMLNRSLGEILQMCQQVISSWCKKRGQIGHLFKGITLDSSECCGTKEIGSGSSCLVPCLRFSYCDQSATPYFESLEGSIHFMADTVCPMLLETIVKGDPRVHEAKIVWAGPESITWVRNPCKTIKGELAVEIVIKKDVVAQNGDAWRIALDACLPVMHLIDTTRSIPYGLQQVQEFLGISCAFDQAVQRLSTSIRMVSKSVLKEHLLLVSNSMTCIGKMIGFNTGGYKALFQSLKVQAPFTEATLFTPMKCLERSGEKCQTDSLASVVSSCSWGKQASIGTGSTFQILWDQEQMAVDKDIGKKMYDFLEFLEPASKANETRSAWRLEVDDLIEENEINEECLSPAYDHLTFDEYDESEKYKSIDQEGRNAHHTSWDNVSASGANSDNWQGWETQKATNTESFKMATTKSSGWSSWDVPQAKVDTIEKTLHIGDDDPLESGWGGSQKSHRKSQSGVNDESKGKVTDEWSHMKVSPGKNAWLASPGLNTQPASGSFRNADNWDTRDAKKPDDPNITDDASKGKESHEWGHETTPSDENAWPSDTKSNDQGKESQWTASATPSQNSWGQGSQTPLDENSWPSDTKSNDQGKESQWTANATPSQSSWGQGSQSWKSRAWPSSKDNDNGIQRNRSTGLPGKRDAQKGWNSNRPPNPSARREPLTEEEEIILADVEPITQRIKKILRDSCDGERLSIEDQKFILDSVFKYHPGKEQKVVGEVDYVMVDTHKEYLSTRCFYVVSQDGSSTDFSYKKCMENFVKVNFSDNAESFNKKYFKRPNGSGQQQQ